MLPHFVFVHKKIISRLQKNKYMDTAQVKGYVTGFGSGPAHENSEDKLFIARSRVIQYEVRDTLCKYNPPWGAPPLTAPLFLLFEGAPARAGGEFGGSSGDAARPAAAGLLRGHPSRPFGRAGGSWLPAGVPRSSILRAAPVDPAPPVGGPGLLAPLPHIPASRHSVCVTFRAKAPSAGKMI